MNDRVPELILVNIYTLSTKKMKLLSFLILALSISCKPQSTYARLTEDCSELSALGFGKNDNSILLKAPERSNSILSKWDQDSPNVASFDMAKGGTVCVTERDRKEKQFRLTH